MASSSPNQLHIYDPSANADVTIALASGPLSLSVSPDGLHAAVASATSVDYVNLQSGMVEQSFALLASSGTSGSVNIGQVVLSAAYIYVLPNSFYGNSAYSINLSSGEITATASAYASSARYDPAVNAIYALQQYGYSLLRYNVSTGLLSASANNSPNNSFSVCGQLWLSPDGSRIYNGCGTVFSVSAETTKDLQYISSLNGLNNIQALNESSALGRLAVVPQSPTYSYPPSTQNDSEVRLFDSNYLNQVGHFALHPFTVDASTYAAHGRYVFFDKAGAFLYVLNQADSSSGLLEDFAIQKIALTSSTSCTVALSNIDPNVSSAGSIGTADITAQFDCTFEATSDSSWIKLISGYYGSGNIQLTYLVRPNNTNAPRTGTISVGGRSFTLMQDAAGSIATLNPLSYKVATADYSKSLDRLVLASGSSNELHLYNLISGLDQSIDLPAPPLSLSVRPDGEYAAVGHNGWVSYVNLRSQTVEQIIPIATSAKYVILASNGYIYVFSSQSWPTVYSLSIGDANWTTTTGSYSSGVPRLHQSGKYIYLGGSWVSKLDITNGIPKTAASGYATSVNSCGNIWLTEDGQRLLTACGTVYRTTESTDDLSANGTLPGDNGITWAAHSIQQHKTAVITSALTGSYTLDDTKLQLYGDTALQFIGQNTLPQFSIGSTTAVGHGRFLFWNTAESKMIIVEQADSTSGLLSDYGVYTLDASGGLANCSYQLSATQFSVSDIGGDSNSIGVTTQSNCDWTATSSSSWVAISSGSAGTGSGTVNLWVSPNYTSSTRSGTLTIAGQTVSISQDATSPCSYAISPQMINAPSDGRNGTFTITADSLCPWTAVSNAPWLTVINGGNGYGSTTITYNVAQNSSASTRTGTIIVGGQTFTVIQTGNTVSITPGLRFVPVVPCRVVDTRQAGVPSGGPSLGADVIRGYLLAHGPCGLPATALAYSLNVTAIPHGSLRYLTVWPASGAPPAVSTLNSYDGRVRSNAAIIPAGPGGGISVFPSDDTDLVLDVNGYFVQDPSSLAYYPVTPCRVADTRVGTGDLGGPALIAGTNRTLPLRSSACNIPAEAQAYSFNYTVVPKQTLGYLTTWPTGQSRPIASSLNAPTGAVTANAVIVPAGTNGSVDVYASNDTDLVIDINGYFAPPGSGGLSLYAVTPCRVFDTRTTTSGQPSNGELDVDVQTSACHTPAGAQAYVLNATVIPSEILRFLSLWPAGEKQPVVSTLNSDDGAVTANMAIVPTQNGSIASFVTDPAHLILDITAFFAP